MKKTIREIAKISGYSKATISRALNNSNLVKEETKKKIDKIIKDLDYKPNIIARSLRTKKTYLIGLILGDIENSFYSRIAKGVLDAAENEEYNVVICNSDYNIKYENKVIKELVDRNIDGLLITTFSPDKNTIKYINDNEVPFVLIDYKLDSKDINYVVNDDYEGGKIVANYLINMGHRKIAYIGNFNLSSFKKRYEGFIDTLKENGIKGSKNFIIDNIRDQSILLNIVNELKSSINDITAIFTPNDDLAISVIENLNLLRVKVPRDISIIGYDNIKASRFTKIPLTTVNQAKYRLGKIAFEQLFNMLGKNEYKNMKMILKPELLIRQSCIEIWVISSNKFQEEYRWGINGSTIYRYLWNRYKYITLFAPKDTKPILDS